MVKGKANLSGIQMLRALAALAVVLHHTLEQSNGAAGRFSPDWLTTAGAAGVDIFFVISGFIMLHVSFRPGKPAPSAGEFLARRATRIYPFYWLCCLGMLSLSALGFFATHDYGAGQIATSLVLAPGHKIIGVAWTLAYEVYFYLVFAASLYRRSAAYSLCATTIVIIAILCLAQSLPAAPGPVFATLIGFLANPLPIEFCLGMGLAYLFGSLTRRQAQWPVAPITAWAAIIAIALAPLYVAHGDTTGLPAGPRTLAWGLPAVLMVAAFLSIGAPRHVAWRLLVQIGDASYALYLTHVFVMAGYGRLIKAPAVGALPQAPVALGIVGISIVVGLAAHHLAERPLLHLVRLATERRTAKGVDQVAAEPLAS